jgi:7-cyano-7-deazaguanine synthase in queuosine biosynthesis
MSAALLSRPLAFLSEDEDEFDFIEAGSPMGLEPYLGFSDPKARAISPDEIILFSGGLDSLAGVADQLIGAGKKVALVSHQGSTMLASKRNALIVALRERIKDNSLFYVPVTINKCQEEAVEFSQRTRSILFATLGLVIARMFGRSALSFFENGIVSFNLPIAEHVLGARASRTTHPRVLADFTRLFSLILSDRFEVVNPYIWKTKAEVVLGLGKLGCTDLIAKTFSCTRVREATKSKRQCGQCSQCVERRFSVLSSHLGEYDSPDAYAVDLFKGEQMRGSDLTLVESYVLRAQKLATMSDQGFLASYGQIFRALPYLPGSPDENAQQIYALHRRHAQEVVAVVDQELRNNASLLQALTLPANSLLAMIMSPMANQPVYLDPIESEDSASTQGAADTTKTPSAHPIFLAIDTDRQKVIFRVGPQVGGSAYRLFFELSKEFEQDREARKRKVEFRFVKAAILARRLEIDEPSLRQCVSRTRKKLERAFLAEVDIQLDAEDIIENRGWRGYRLNPFLFLVSPSQLEHSL